MKHLALKSVYVVIALAVCALAIEMLMLAFRPSPAAFARPTEIFTALPNLIFLSGGSVSDTLSTIVRTLVAFSISVPSGLLVGVVVAKTRIARIPGEFIVDFLRSVPATSLVPLFIVIFGTGDAPKIAAGAYTGTLSVAISVIVGYRSLDPTRLYSAMQIGLRGFRRVLWAELPEMSPSVFVGLRAAASLSLILVVVSEMFVGSDNGLGKVIMDKRYSDDVPGLYAAIFVSGIIGYGLNMILVGIESILAKRYYLVT